MVENKFLSNLHCKQQMNNLVCLRVKIVQLFVGIAVVVLMAKYLNLTLDYFAVVVVDAVVVVLFDDVVVVVQLNKCCAVVARGKDCVNQHSKMKV